MLRIGMEMVCDDVDDCVGEYDVCGVRNGLGEVYECGCAPVHGECDCDEASGCFGRVWRHVHG